MKLKAFIFIVIAGVLWGTSPLFVSYLSPRGFSSVELTSVRALITGIALGCLILFTKRTKFRASPLNLLLFILNGAAFVGTASFYFQGIKMTSSATAVVLMYTAPIYVLIFSVIFLGERLTRLKVFSMALMLVGCVLVSGIAEGFAFDGVGVIFGVLAGISYGAYNIITKILMRRGSDPTATTFYSFSFAAVISLFIVPPTELFGCVADNLPMSVPMLILFGITTCVAPYFLYTFALRDLSAGTASSLGIIEPMSATLFSAVFLSEIPSIFSWIGIVLILGAVVLLGVAEKQLIGEKNEQNDK